MKTSIILLVGIICLWVFGSYQPIAVVESSTAVVNNQQVKCPKCGGTGSIEVSAPCVKCKGTGKGESLRTSGDKKSPFASEPACVNCKGSGKVPRPDKCPQCKGAGKVEATASEAKKTKTARANLSLWEKILASLRIKPDANCRPQRMLGGSYPLVAKYIEITANPAYKVRVIKWERARLEGTEWIVKTGIEFMDKSGEWARQEKEFIVENREVKGIRKEGRQAGVSRQKSNLLFKFEARISKSDLSCVVRRTKKETNYPPRADPLKAENDRKQKSQTL